MRKYLAWEAHDKGVDIHLLAEPTKLELLQKEYEKKKEQFKSSVRIGGQFNLIIHNVAAFGDCFEKSSTNLMRSKKYNNEHISHWDFLS
uniref:Pre-mRNA-splicing factor SLU7 domain-containing protein n=1 Tax=Glossina palpalis gambiensis TaxID=67801 RepID=A0A1B0C577_9MUSC